MTKHSEKKAYKFLYIVHKVSIQSNRAVLLVQWSAFTSYTPMLRVRIRLRSRGFFLQVLSEKYEIIQKETRVDPYIVINYSQGWPTVKNCGK